jgi:hypothetical protein
MKTSQFPPIPFVASRDPTMARCRVRRGSIGTSETPCLRSDSRSRNSNDPFPELSLQERIIRAAAASVVSTVSFLEISHVVKLPTSMGAPFPLIDLSLSVMVTTAVQTRYLNDLPCFSTTTRIRLCNPTIHIAMENDKGEHYQLEAHGNVMF